MAETIRMDGPTPNGGEYAVLSFFDESGRLADESKAVRCIITEYGPDGEVVSETFGFVGGVPQEPF